MSVYNKEENKPDTTHAHNKTDNTKGASGATLWSIR